MLPGETIRSGAPEFCPECETRAKLGVYKSAAGYYIGTHCECGPYTRESYDYYPDRPTAEKHYALGTWQPRL